MQLKCLEVNIEYHISTKPIRNLSLWVYFAESIIKEALRLSSASIMIRVASDDFILTLDSGQETAIRKGDYIALYPRLIHLDPDIYPNPLVKTPNSITLK